ncbi:MAG: 3'-5' exonuclease [Thermofilaceae archaeon]
MPFGANLDMIFEEFGRLAVENSTQPILDLANAVMLSAKRKHTKVLKAAEQGGTRPKLLVFKDPQEEAEWVASRVKELWDEGIELGRMAVLFRSMYLVRPLELALSKRGIPYRTYGGLRFSETAHIKDVLCHLRVMVNPRDEIAWYRVLMLVEGVGPKTAERLASEIGQNGQWEAALGRSAVGKAAEGLKRLLLALGEAVEKKFPSEVLDSVLDYYKPVLKRTYDDYARRQWDLEALRHIAASYRSLEELLLDLVALEPPEKVLEERHDERLDTRPLVLFTIHSAKGLEWEAVFVIGLADGHLPLSYSVFGEEELEEERRLLYVAITRARRLLFLTMAHEGKRSLLRLSRFLDTEEVKACLDLLGPEPFESSGGLPVREHLIRRILDAG